MQPAGAQNLDIQIARAKVSELCGVAPSTISKHLSILYHAGLIESRKEERWVFYRLPGKEAAVVVREAVDWVLKSLGGTPQAAADGKRLKAILKIDPKVICQRQPRK